MVVEVYECPKCHQSVRLEGPSKPALMAHFKAHVQNCTGPPPTPVHRTFHARGGNGRTGILGRLFKRPPARRPAAHMTANTSIGSLPQMLAELEALDEAYMEDLYATPEPEKPAPPMAETIQTEVEPPQEEPPQVGAAPVDALLEAKSQYYKKYGFDFNRESAVKNFQEFQKVREYFLLRDRVFALTELYSIFSLSFVDYYFGYGMDDHKKHNWILGMSEIREDLEQLKGRAKQGMWDPDYEGIIELNLNIKFEAMINAHTMDSKSARASEKHERLLEMAKAMIAQSEEKDELRNLMDELEGKDKEGAS